MHAGFFDVLHDAADDYIGSVGEGIHVHFRGFFQELVNEHGPSRAHQRGLRDIFLHRVHVVGNHHGAAAEDITRAHENRQTNLSRNARGFFRHQRGPIARLRNFQLFEQAAEPTADRKSTRLNSSHDQISYAVFCLKKKKKRKKITKKTKRKKKKKKKRKNKK